MAMEAIGSAQAALTAGVHLRKLIGEAERAEQVVATAAAQLARVAEDLSAERRAAMSAADRLDDEAIRLEMLVQAAEAQIECDDRHLSSLKALETLFVLGRDSANKRLLDGGKIVSHAAIAAIGALEKSAAKAATSGQATPPPPAPTAVATAPKVPAAAASAAPSMPPAAAPPTQAWQPWGTPAC